MEGCLSFIDLDELITNELFKISVDVRISSILLVMHLPYLMMIQSFFLDNFPVAEQIPENSESISKSVAVSSNNKNKNQNNQDKKKDVSIESSRS